MKKKDQVQQRDSSRRFKWQQNLTQMTQDTLHIKMKFFIQYSFSQYDQIRRKLPIWYLLRKSLPYDFIVCAVAQLKPDAWEIKSMQKKFSHIKYC